MKCVSFQLQPSPDLSLVVPILSAEDALEPLFFRPDLERGEVGHEAHQDQGICGRSKANRRSGQDQQQATLRPARAARRPEEVHAGSLDYSSVSLDGVLRITIIHFLRGDRIRGK